MYVGGGEKKKKRRGISYENREGERNKMENIRYFGNCEKKKIYIYILKNGIIK